MRRQINQAGRDLIKSFEGLSLVSYKCPAGIWTVGWGSTGKHVKQGMKITRQEAESLLDADLARFETFVEQNAGECTDNQFAALVSFAFNVGTGALEESTLLRLHRAGKYPLAQLQFSKWVHAGGKKLNGLIKRRAAEANLYGAE